MKLIELNLSATCALMLISTPLFGQTPTISGFSPASGSVGSSVTLTGSGFSPVTSSNLVFLGAVRAAVSEAAPTSLTVIVPSGASYAPPSVAVGGWSVQAQNFFLPTFAGNQQLKSNYFSPAVGLPTGSARNALVASDMDGDGWPDLVAAGTGSPASARIHIYRNLGLGGALTVNSFASSVGPATTALSTRITLGDVDGDGRQDIIEVPQTPGNSAIYIHRNISTPGVLEAGSFAPRVRFTSANVTRAILADLNHDGYPELIVCSARGTNISIFPNTGNPGTLDTNTFGAPIEQPTGGANRDIVANDFDGDGWIDLATSSDGPVDTIAESGAVYILRNTGVGSFEPFVSLSASNLFGFFLQSGDLDLDGRIDLIVNNHDSSIGVFKNLSQPGSLSSNSFAPPMALPTGDLPGQTSIADLDGDGLPDLIVGDSQSQSLLKNLGGGVFAPKVSLAGATSALGAVANDLNGDGKPDLALFGQTSGPILIENLVPPPEPPAINSLNPSHLKVNEGDTVIFTVDAAGTPKLYYQWSFNGTKLAGETSSQLSLSNVVKAMAGTYSIVVSNVAGQAFSNAVLEVNSAPVADAGATEMLLISPNGSNAVAVLDASRSSDPDGDELSYEWFRAGYATPFASGVVAVTTLPLGSNLLTLVVSDGLASNSQNFMVEVITTLEAVGRLTQLVIDGADNPQPLLASLQAALASIDRSQPEVAINQLEAFNNKVMAQVEPVDPALAAQLLADSQAIIDALNGGLALPDVPLEISSIKTGEHGPKLKIKGQGCRTHIVEMSTNLVDWAPIGVANKCGEIEFEYDDVQSGSITPRYYRVVSPR